jgi:hypothetical protein
MDQTSQKIALKQLREGSGIITEPSAVAPDARVDIASNAQD